MAARALVGVVADDRRSSRPACRRAGRRARGRPRSRRPRGAGRRSGPGARRRSRPGRPCRRRAATRCASRTRRDAHPRARRRARAPRAATHAGADARSSRGDVAETSRARYGSEKMTGYSAELLVVFASPRHRLHVDLHRRLSRELHVGRGSGRSTVFVSPGLISVDRLRLRDRRAVLCWIVSVTSMPTSCESPESLTATSNARSVVAVTVSRLSRARASGRPAAPSTRLERRAVQPAGRRRRSRRRGAAGARAPSCAGSTSSGFATKFDVGHRTRRDALVLELRRSPARGRGRPRRRRSR